LENRAADQVLTTTYEQIFAWARRAAVTPVRLGLACCAVEMVPEVERQPEWLPPDEAGLRAAPARSDVLIVAGTISEKMAPVLRRLWDEMPAPKWAIALGACATCGGPFRTYAVTQGLDRILPVDVYVPGCPPGPEALLRGLRHLQMKIERGQKRPRP
jgi:NADH-quinone oxidoreductase subunit B